MVTYTIKGWSDWLYAASNTATIAPPPGATDPDGTNNTATLDLHSYVFFVN